MPGERLSDCCLMPGERLSDCCLMPGEKCSYIMPRTDYTGIKQQSLNHSHNDLEH
jgi:hypothetical protein